MKDRDGNEWVLVPVNATEALMKPFHDVAFDEGSGGSPDYESAWSDLIAAAPQFVAGEVADEMCERMRESIRRAIDAWDNTTNSKSHDGRLWQCMEELRQEIGNGESGDA